MNKTIKFKMWLQKQLNLPRFVIGDYATVHGYEEKIKGIVTDIAFPTYWAYYVKFTKPIQSGKYKGRESWWCSDTNLTIPYLGDLKEWDT